MGHAATRDLPSVRTALRLGGARDHRPPAAVRVVVAGLVAAAASLGADWLLARLAVAVVPGNAGYPHFAFSDYSTLTLLGVAAATLGWPVLTRLCLAPRWLYLRLAVVVTVVLLVPDVAIWVQGQPGSAVVFLALMHLAIAVITYAAVVLIAPVRPPRAPAVPPPALSPRTPRRP